METDGLPTPDPSSFYASDAALRRPVGAARRSLAFSVSSSLRNELRWLPGETNWIEGVQLLSVYVILGILFFYLPEPQHVAP